MNKNWESTIAGIDGESLAFCTLLILFVIFIGFLLFLLLHHIEVNQPLYYGASERSAHVCSYYGARYGSSGLRQYRRYFSGKTEEVQVKHIHEYGTSMLRDIPKEDKVNRTERVKYLEAELVKYRNEISLLKLKCEDWKKIANLASERFQSMKKECENKACTICLTNEKDLAFGCGHMTCRNCGSKLSKCPICREKITRRIKLFPG